MIYQLLVACSILLVASAASSAQTLPTQQDLTPRLQELPNTIEVVPSRLFNSEFQSVVLNYERQLVSFLAGELFAGLALHPADFSTNGDLGKPGYEVGVAIRTYMTSEDRIANYYVRFSGELTSNPIEFNGLIRQPGEVFERKTRVEAKRKRQEFGIGVGAKFIASPGFTLDVLAGLGISRVGLFTSDRQDIRVGRGDELFGRVGARVNAYGDYLLPRVRIGFGYSF